MKIKIELELDDWELANIKALLNGDTTTNKNIADLLVFAAMIKDHVLRIQDLIQENECLDLMPGQSKTSRAGDILEILAKRGCI